ncbi:MAG: glycosyltransferase family 4 protein [Deltaproteobacteria bacterium]|nr:glycosyltransferase family 4 protein [Deltaproteobacteria bacterium]
MIKVLHIHTLPVISGSGINTFLSMNGLDRTQYLSELACAPGGALIRKIQRHEFRVHIFKHLTQPLNPAKDLLTLFNLTLFLVNHPFHIVHTHNSKAGFLGRLAARLTGVPVVVHTVHGFAFHDEEPLWRRRLFRNLERLASRWCHKMIFISQPLIDWALREKIVSGDKIVKIYSGIELDQFQPLSRNDIDRIREKWQIGREDPVIGIVSKLWEGKGHENLLHAIRGLKKGMKDVKLVIVGEGHLQTYLEHKVRELDLNNAVIFTGFQENVAEFIATFDVAVLPSLFEGMGRVLLEAMAMEKPVVASRVGGIPDLVEHGANGLLVPPGDIHELENALKKVLIDKAMAKKMGRMGRQRVTKRFSSEAMVRAIEHVYRELLSVKGISIDH